MNFDQCIPFESDTTAGWLEMTGISALAGHLRRSREEWWLRCQVSSLMGGWKLGFHMHGDVWRGKKHSISWVTRQHQLATTGNVWE